jgi:hypothetical protein
VNGNPCEHHDKAQRSFPTSLKGRATRDSAIRLCATEKYMIDVHNAIFRCKNHSFHNPRNAMNVYNPWAGNIPVPYGFVKGSHDVT